MLNGIENLDYKESEQIAFLKSKYINKVVERID
jgi:hypothetical protein